MIKLLRAPDLLYPQAANENILTLLQPIIQLASEVLKLFMQK